MCWQDIVIGRQMRVGRSFNVDEAGRMIPANPNRIGFLVGRLPGFGMRLYIGQPGDGSPVATVGMAGDPPFHVQYYGQLVTMTFGALGADGSDTTLTELVADFLPPTGSGLDGIINLGV